MKIEQKRIRATKKLLSNINKEDIFVLGVKVDREIKDILKEKELITKLDSKVTVFPSPLLGIMCKRNSIGEYIPKKDKPMEVAYRAQEWSIQDWGGYSHTGTSYVPYKRYPRKFIEPKEFKLIIRENESKEKFLQINRSFKNNNESCKDIIFAANLLLEIVGSVDAFKVNLNSNTIEYDEIETLNWEILPPGERIWESIQKGKQNILSKSQKTLISERFNFINEFNPISRKKGVGGYTGYVIFEFKFKEKNIFIFDSILYGDATYIFEDNWSSVSKLTKKEIITKGLAKDRIIHNKLWEEKLKQYLEEQS